MKELHGAQREAVLPLFQAYSSNRAVIFSVLEGQYDGHIFADNETQPRWALLTAPFLQHFVAGEPIEGCAEALEELLFQRILPAQEEKELVVFGDGERWHGSLGEVFTRHHGISDGRKILAFSPEGFRGIPRPALPAAIHCSLLQSKLHPASRQATWSARLTQDEQVICHCDALMIGDGLAELDIFTEEAYRGRGYATYAAILLINQLLREGLTPTWSCWPYRVESQHLAQKLGFLPQPDAQAFIWAEGM